MIGAWLQGLPSRSMTISAHHPRELASSPSDGPWTDSLASHGTKPLSGRSPAPDTVEHSSRAVQRPSSLSSGHVGNCSKCKVSVSKSDQPSRAGFDARQLKQHRTQRYLRRSTCQRLDTSCSTCERYESAGSTLSSGHHKSPKLPSEASHSASPHAWFGARRLQSVERQYEDRRFVPVCAPFPFSESVQGSVKALVKNEP